MMCDGCKELADLAKKHGVSRIKHTRKKQPHCDAPVTCTCQHRRVQEGFVAVREDDR